MAGIYFEATAFDKRLKNNTVRRCKNITDLYNELIAAAVGYVPASLTAKDVESGFFFKNYPILHKRINALIENLSSNLQTNIEDGNTDAWDISNAKYDALIELIKAKADKAGVDISQRLQKKWNNHNLSALQAFQDREINGVKLSQRIWNLSQQTKTELELAMEIGIGDGKSAAALSRDVRKYLKDPNKLFRRVRDKKTGQLRLSKAAAAYHPGRGKYRSSYKNALRMTATENNMAYRSADFERNQELDFVLGIEIHLSGNHPVVDICDDLKGKYPKTFKFTGWHPWCRCYTTTILPNEEDMLNYLSMSAEEQAQSQFSGRITDFPDKFKDFIAENEERLKNNQKMPVFILDNKKAVDKILNPTMSIAERAKIRHAQRTEAQKAAIQDAWNERKKKHALIGKTANNVLNVAKDYGEVDMSALQAAISSGNIDAMKAEAKRVAKVVAETKKQEKALADLIPNAHSLHKSYSMRELKSSYKELDGVMDKWLSKYNYSSLEKAPLQHLKNKLDFEISTPTFNYSNKNIIKKALAEKIRDIDKRIEWDNMLAKASELRTFKTKSVAYRNCISRIEDAIKNNDLKELQKRISEAEKQQTKILDKQIGRAGSTKGAINKEYKGAATGKDLSGTIDVSKMVSKDPYGGTFTNNIAQMQGFDAPAKLVSEQDFAVLEKDCGEVFYRTLNPTRFRGKMMSSEEFASQMYVADSLELNGPGGRVYGDGIYVATSSWNGNKLMPLTADRKLDAYSESACYGNGSHKTLEMTWVRKPKIVKQTELRKMWGKLTPAQKKKFGGLYCENTYACALGYDAMYCDGPNYMVIWNRSIIAVKNRK